MKFAGWPGPLSAVIGGISAGSLKGETDVLRSPESWTRDLTASATRLELICISSVTCEMSDIAPVRSSETFACERVESEWF